MNQSTKTRNLVTAGVMAAMITVMTAYILHIPVGNGYIHLGDALIYLAACLLPRPYAMLAAAVGAGLADILTYPVWAPATIIIKALLVLPFTSKGDKILTLRNGLCTIPGGIITFSGYYFAEALMMLLGSIDSAGMSTPQIFTAALASIPGNLIQSCGSAVIFIILALALDKAGFKKKVLK